MPTAVIMPKVDMDQASGTIARWLKKEGDEVRQGEIILEIETEKIAIEVESPASGVLGEILFADGETVPIATTIAHIFAPGEALPHKSEMPKERKDVTSVPATPVARKMATASGIDLTTVSGSGPGGRVTKKDVAALLSVPPTPERGEERVYATPAARRVAAENGVALEAVVGSGPDGRVQVDDVLQAVSASAIASSSPVVRSPATTTHEVIPLLGKRRAIAERLTASHQTVPHIHFTARIDMTRFEETRTRLNQRATPDGSSHISTTALLAKIVARTLLDHPWLNSSFLEATDVRAAEIHLFADVNMGIAVALEDGLIVPVVRNADAKGVAQIAAEIKDLAERTRAGKLLPTEVRQGTFTISNLGPYGVEQFTAIINPPQAAILAVGAIQPEVVADADGQVAVRPIMHITLVADHRVVDGVVAARFLASLKAALEDPVLLLF